MIDKNFKDHQLSFELEGFEEHVDEAAQIKPEEAAQISEAARRAFEAEIAQRTGAKFDPEQDDEDRGRWIPAYLKLVEHGWPWRVAVYIGWAASPKIYRWPKTITALSTEVLGLTSPRAIYNWRRKFPAIDAIVAAMQAAPLMEHRADVIAALIRVASEADYKGHADRKLFLELTGDYISKSELKADFGRVRDLGELSDEELDELDPTLDEDLEGARI